MNVRKTLISSGEHIAAQHLLGADYTDEEYIAAVEAAREVGVGEAYANRVLGTDDAALISGVEQDRGDDVVMAAERRLRRRGVDPKKASYSEFREALLAVES